MPFNVLSISQVLCVTRGLDYLHTRGVIHGDVKPVGISFHPAHVSMSLTKFKQNILVNAKGDACLADFGLSIVACNKISSRDQGRRARCHSSLWVAPETLNEGRISKEVDVFCYSLVALEVRCFGNTGSCHADRSVQIFKGGSPWGQATAPQIMTNIALAKRPSRPKGAEPLELTTEVWNCLTRCWHQNPEERMTISEVLALLNTT